MEKFQAVYESLNVVNEYVNSNLLQKPEAYIFNKYKNKIANSNFLDIGIGTGRTTEFLIDEVQAYTGIDISSNMIASAKLKYSKINSQLLTVDARAMQLFKDNTYDVILFSFNGIDYVSKKDRELIFNEIKRVSKNDALYIFSTHNLNNLPLLFQFKKSLHPRLLLNELKRQFHLKLKNRSLALNELSNINELEINDGAHDFSLKTLYTSPIHQIKQLKSFGFENIEIYGLKDGVEIPTDSLNKNEEPWLYFTCSIKK